MEANCPVRTPYYGYSSTLDIKGEHEHISSHNLYTVVTLRTAAQPAEYTECEVHADI